MAFVFLRPPRRLTEIEALRLVVCARTVLGEFTEVWRDDRRSGEAFDPPKGQLELDRWRRRCARRRRAVEK